ncbi:MAG: sulfatase-like hydrolase/transferase [Sphingomonadaceae bacterium]
MAGTGFNRRQVMGGMGAAALATVPAVQAVAKAGGKLPNIVFIMVDDLGYADLSCTGSSHIRTPAIDSIAANGMLLDQGYSSTPICSPTRTALLTGKYAQRFRLGVEEPLGPDLPKENYLSTDTPTIASVLRDIGYRTRLVGKWHLGEPPEHGPLQHGYDEFYGIVEGAADYFRHHMVMQGQEVGMGLTRDNTPIKEEGYLTDMFGDETVRMIDSAGDKPFFISLHFNAPHWPWEGREDAEAAKAVNNSFDYTGGSLAKYKEMMEATDDNVAKVLDALRRSGKLDNTIVVFTSDNGGERYSQTWPYVGHKGEVLEGGIHVPILIQWPAKIPAGTRSGQVMASMDFLPTFLGMAGGNVAKAGTFDGVDLSAHLVSAAPAVERTIFWRFNAQNQAAVRQGDWKFVKIGGKERLFNLAADPHERAERQRSNPQKFEELKMAWDRWNSQMLPYRLDGWTEDLTKTYIDRY